MKKLFPDKKFFSKKGLMEFLDKKGFYIVLILCIAVVGVTAYLVTGGRNSLSDREFDAENLLQDPEGNSLAGIGDERVLDITDEDGVQSAVDALASGANVTVTPTPASDKGAVKATPGKDENASSKSTATQPTKTDSKPKSGGETPSPSKKVSFIMPVAGDITFEYAMDKLVYSKTLEDWRTHSGIDMAADRGTNVKCAADGVVTEVKTDPRFGITVIVDHENGLKTVYANLASEDAVVPNQKVKQGDIIGSVGNTALFESVEQTHLHFEVLKDNVNVDPTGYLPVKK